MELSERIRDYRGANDMSMREFAKVCKLTEQTVCNIENGKAKPTALTRAKIEHVIGKE